MSYNYISDVVVCIISVLMLILLRTTYLTKSRGLFLLKLGLINIVYCSLASQFLNSYLLPRVGQINVNLIYTEYNALHIGYIVELALFIFYMYDLLNFHNKLAQVSVIVIVCIYAVLELTSVFTHISFWVGNDNVIHNNGVTSLYLAWYVIMMVIFTVTIIVKNKVIVRRLYQAIFAVFSFCMFMMV